ncbi:TetR/AcrR family transcriptional regulator [Streptomyces sp. NPDC051217]|uniref:TetR/AcrR family transcriptional regulator n=1 Tax=Streptomyces sp. NPDC051217 TaxID=3365644 RepID=UPI0037B4A72D
MPRKDQVRNRERVIEAAVAVFAQSGPGASLETVARAAGLGTTTLYRHFPSRDDLVEAVLDELVRPVRAAAERVERIGDPHEAFRQLFLQSCAMPDHDVTVFARLAVTSPRVERHADALVVGVVRRVTERLREAGGLRAGLTAEDVAMFVRMAERTAGREQRATATEVLLAGITRVEA